MHSRGGVFPGHPPSLFLAYTPEVNSWWPLCSLLSLTGFIRLKLSFSWCTETPFVTYWTYLSFFIDMQGPRLSSVETRKSVKESSTWRKLSAVPEVCKGLTGGKYFILHDRHSAANIMCYYLLLLLVWLIVAQLCLLIKANSFIVNHFPFSLCLSSKLPTVSVLLLVSCCMQSCTHEYAAVLAVTITWTVQLACAKFLSECSYVISLIIF